MPTNQQFFSIGLPKWPCMVVKGDKIKVDEAMVVIIRTGSFYFGSNDPAFADHLYKILEIDPKKYKSRPIDKIAVIQDRETEYGVLELEYLKNSRILSSYVRGPHGWCNWDGEIFSNNYNIGKWPSVETVYNEWKLIAKNFPFLNLKCQLYNGEHFEDGIKPIIEYRVKDGRVSMSIPKDELEKPDRESMSDEIMGKLMSGVEYGRGCTPIQFLQALKCTDVYLREKKNVRVN